MPRWWALLEMADAWSRPPWDLFGGHPVTWYQRWMVRRHLVGDKLERDAQVWKQRLEDVGRG